MRGSNSGPRKAKDEEATENVNRNTALKQHDAGKHLTKLDLIKPFLSCLFQLFPLPLQCISAPSAPAALPWKADALRVKHQTGSWGTWLCYWVGQTQHHVFLFSAWPVTLPTRSSWMPGLLLRFLCASSGGCRRWVSGCGEGARRGVGRLRAAPPARSCSGMLRAQLKVSALTCEHQAVFT